METMRKRFSLAEEEVGLEAPTFSFSMACAGPYQRRWSTERTTNSPDQ